MVLPGLFSDDDRLPQRSCNSFPISRPEMSSRTARGKRTTRCTGFDGNSCAAALAASASTHTRAAVVLSHDSFSELRLSEPGL